MVGARNGTTLTFLMTTLTPAYSEFEVAMADYTRRLNANEPLPRPPEAAWTREDVVISKEDYLSCYEGGWMDQVSQLHIPINEWDSNGWPGMLFKRKL